MHAQVACICACPSFGGQMCFDFDIKSDDKVADPFAASTPKTLCAFFDWFHQISGKYRHAHGRGFRVIPSAIRASSNVIIASAPCTLCARRKCGFSRTAAAGSAGRRCAFDVHCSKPHNAHCCAPASHLKCAFHM